MELVKPQTKFKLISTFTDTTGRTYEIDLQQIISDHLADEIFHELDELSEDESFLLTLKNNKE